MLAGFMYISAFNTGSPPWNSVGFLAMAIRTTWYGICAHTHTYIYIHIILYTHKNVINIQMNILTINCSTMSQMVSHGGH